MPNNLTQLGSVRFSFARRVELAVKPRGNICGLTDIRTCSSFVESEKGNSDWRHLRIPGFYAGVAISDAVRNLLLIESVAFTNARGPVVYLVECDAAGVIIGYTFLDMGDATRIIGEYRDHLSLRDPLLVPKSVRIARVYHESADVSVFTQLKDGFAGKYFCGGVHLGKDRPDLEQIRVMS